MKQKLRSTTIGETHVLSCLLQDSITCRHWFKVERGSVKIFLSRFCHEEDCHQQNYRQQDYQKQDYQKQICREEDCHKHSSKQHSGEKYRTNSILTILNVKNCYEKNLFDTNDFFQLYCMVCTDFSQVHFIFSSCEFECKVSSFNIELEDVGQTWPS